MSQVNESKQQEQMGHTLIIKPIIIDVLGMLLGSLFIISLTIHSFISSEAVKFLTTYSAWEFLAQCWKSLFLGVLSVAALIASIKLRQYKLCDDEFVGVNYWTHVPVFRYSINQDLVQAVLSPESGSFWSKISRANSFLKMEFKDGMVLKQRVTQNGVSILIAELEKNGKLLRS
jgi:hypothetical protein